VLRKGDIPTLKALVEKTPQVLDTRDGDGRTPLHCAAGETTPFIASDGSYLLFSRQYDLWVSFRGEGNAWLEPVKFGPEVNSPSSELCPVVTADGKYLFFLSQRGGESHAYWVRADVIEKARPAGLKK